MRKWLAVRKDMDEIFLEESQEAVKFMVIKRFPVDLYPIELDSVSGEPVLGRRLCEGDLGDI